MFRHISNVSSNISRNICLSLMQETKKKFSSVMLKPFLINSRDFNNILKAVKQSSRNNYNSLRPDCVKGLLFAFSLVRVLEYVGVKEEEPELTKIINRARLLLEEGDINKATDQFNIALKCAQTLQSEDDVYLIKEQLAAIAVEVNQFEKAEMLYLDIMNHLLHNGLKTDDLKVVYVNYKLAGIYQSLNNFGKAKEIFDSCYSTLKPKIKKSLKHKDEETVVLWIMVLIGIAYYHLNKSNVDGTLDGAYQYFKEAYDVCIQIHGEVSEQAALLLKDLGAVCYQKGDLEPAVEYLEKATEIGKHLPGMKEMSSVYVSLGNVYLRQNLLKDAEVNCNQGRKNAVRHHYQDGIKEAQACLDEIKKAQQ